ncbi:MAG: hypothetical protein WCD66_10675 [Rhodanobacteraceae bacterium]
MQMKPMGPAAGWAWLRRGTRIVLGYPKAMLGAAGLLFLLMIPVSMVMGSMQLAVGSQSALWGITYLAGILGTLVVYPVLMGGYLRMIDQRERGVEAGASMLLQPLNKGAGGARLARFGLAMSLVYLLLLAVTYFSFGRGLIDWYMQVLSMQMSGAKTPSMPAVPDNFAGAVLIMCVLGCFAGAILSLGTAQVALRGAEPLMALGDAVRGVFRNLLPLLVLGLCLLLAALAFFVVIFVVLSMVVLIAKLVGVLLAVLLVLVLYLFLMFVGNAVFMGVVYAMWDDIAGGDRQQAHPESTAAIEA